MKSSKKENCYLSKNDEKPVDVVVIGSFGRMVFDYEKDGKHRIMKVLITRENLSLLQEISRKN